MLITAIALGILTAIYSGFLWLLFFGLGRLSPGGNATTPTVSVVVAARDEEKHIGACLRSLLSQTYGPVADIVVADDGSVDGTARVVQKVAESHPRVKLIAIDRTPPGWAPKKYALSQAIAASSGDIILTTDADCLVPPTWIEGMIREFEPPVGAVAGLVRLDHHGAKTTLWHRLQDLELLSLFIAAAGGTALGIIHTASGGNLAYRREAFLDAGGFEPIRGLVSGDDDLLVQQITARTDWKLRFCSDPNTVVTTLPHRQTRDFFRQRQRWASKAIHQRPGNLFFLLVTFLLNLSLLATLGVSLVAGWVLVPVLLSLAVKFVSEFALLWRGTRRFQTMRLLTVFPLWELLHIPSVVFSGLAGLSWNLRWKGRHFRGQRGLR